MERIEERESLLKGLWWPTALVMVTFRCVTNDPKLGQFGLSSLGCLSGFFPAWLFLARLPPMSGPQLGSLGQLWGQLPVLFHCPAGQAGLVHMVAKGLLAARKAATSPLDTWAWNAHNLTSPAFCCSEHVTHSPNLRAGETDFRSWWAELQIMTTFSNLP